MSKIQNGGEWGIEVLLGMHGKTHVDEGKGG